MKVHFLITFVLISTTHVISSQAQNYFRNPISDHFEDEPSMVKFNGSYYMVFTRVLPYRLEILRSSILSDFRNADQQEIYTAPLENLFISGPKIHVVRDELYIYFITGTAWTQPRFQVIKCMDSRNPLGDWSNGTRLMPNEENYDFDGTVMDYYGELYFIYSGIPEGEDLFELYIAKMESPMEVTSPRALLRTPTMDWEKHNFPNNNAPAIIQRDGRTFLVFSASSWQSPNYCLGMMGIDGGKDPMVSSNWWNDLDRCVFARNDTEAVYGPGVASFVESPDETELWMVYSAGDQIVWGQRFNMQIRIQKIGWEMNSPKYPPALGLQQEQEIPSGE